MARSERLAQEEGGIQQDVRMQLISLIELSQGSKLFGSLRCREKNGEQCDPLHNGRVACVNYASQILRLVDEDLWVGPAGTWMKDVIWDLKTAGWYQIPPAKAITGDIVIWDFFQSLSDKANNRKGNQHIGFIWTPHSAVSMAREDPFRDDSERSPQQHPLYFDGPGRVDGPRTILSVWSHPKLQTS